MADTTAIPTKVYAQGPWSLTELLPEASDEVLGERLAAISAEVDWLEARRDELGPELSADRFLEIVRRYEALVEKVYVVSAYGSLWFAEDTQSEAALTFKNRVQYELTPLQNRILFLTLWWKGLDDAEAERLLPAAEAEPDLRFFLEDLRRTRPFMLEEQAEQIINLKDADGIDAVLTLHSMLTNRLEYELEVDGERLKLNRDELMAHVFSPDPDRRAAAYQELYRVYGAEATVLGQIYANRVRDWQNEHVELRGYASAVAVRNIANDVPDEAVDVLLETAEANTAIFQRYFLWKAGQLGLDRLRRYDLYAPLAPVDKTIDYSEAVELVLSTFERFHPEIARQAERVFADDHLDSELRPGKKGGAFCATVLPSQTPWVLVNYTGKVRDVATLAHELGHAIHSLAAEEHSVLTQHACLPLAETASVFAEMLLTDRLLEGESDPAVRRELLASAVDDAYATVQRQAYFVLFEKAAHEAVLAGRSTDELSEIYFETLGRQFGDSVELSPEFRHEWVSIPHIFATPFYCYAYSFGQLLVLALYQRYKQEGESFIPGYRRLLAHGGSARPATILAEIGVDMTDRAFWQGGYDVVSGMVAELEAL